MSSPAASSPFRRSVIARRSALGLCRAFLGAWAVWQLTAAAVVAQCPGDCDGDGVVSVAEVVTGVTIALGGVPTAACAPMDANGDGRVEVNELILAVQAVLGSCASPILVSDYIQAVLEIESGVVGTVHQSVAPVGADGPPIVAPTSLTAINGGSTRVRLTASRPFSTIYISAEGPGAEPVAGHYTVHLPTAVTEAVLQLTVAPDAPTGLRWVFRGADSTIGPPATTEITLTRVGSGDLQISLTWFVDADLDLHVIEPSGEDVSWANTRSASGAELDLDSICDGVRNENISWPVGPAPPGHYAVRAQYFLPCRDEEPFIDYVVTLQRAGMPPETIEGRFTQRGTTTVVEFDR